VLPPARCPAISLRGDPRTTLATCVAPTPEVPLCRNGPRGRRNREHNSTRHRSRRSAGNRGTCRPTTSLASRLQRRCWRFLGWTHACSGASSGPIALSETTLAQNERRSCDRRRDSILSPGPASTAPESRYATARLMRVARQPTAWKARGRPLLASRPHEERSKMIKPLANDLETLSLPRSHRGAADQAAGSAGTDGPHASAIRQ